MSRRAWLIVLWLYGIGAAIDFGAHLYADRNAGHDWLSPASFAVALSGSLFWPVDGVAQLLLLR